MKRTRRYSLEEDATEPGVILTAKQIMAEVLDQNAGLLAPLVCEPTKPSVTPIFRILDPALASYRSGSSKALWPSPSLNQALRRLVAVSTAEFQIQQSDSATTSPRFHHQVVTHITQQLKKNAEMARRAKIIRRAAGVAEKHMESYYADIVLENLPNVPTPSSARQTRLRTLFEPFPYFENYELLVDAELAGLSLVHKRIDSIAFCGAGPFPLSGILAQVKTGAHVELIEIDFQAAKQATKLLHQLERIDVLEPDAISVTVADAGTVDLRDHDAILVASLLPNNTLVSISEGSARPKEGEFAPTLIARSADELASLFCYEPISIGDVESAGWQHIGTVAPERTLETTSDKAATNKYANKILAVADSSVLNSTEFFQHARR